MERLTITVPPSLARDLNYIARRAGISRSSVVVQLLAEAPYLAEMMRLLPEDGATEEDVVRARGASVAIVNKRLEEFREQVAALDQVMGAKNG